MIRFVVREGDRGGGSYILSEFTAVGIRVSASWNASDL